MRSCPACSRPMQRSHVLDVAVDVCPGCRGVFLDPGDAEAQGIETSALFGADASTTRDLGLTRRLCPAHGQEMRRFRLETGAAPVEIERGDCCGGVFLDAGEHQLFAHAARRAASLSEGLGEGRVRTSSGAVFSAPPPPGESTAPSSRQQGFANVCKGLVAMGTAPQGPDAAPQPIRATEPTQRHCPRCGAAYAADRSGGVEVDVCASCGSIFLDAGEMEAKGVDTSALFGVGPEAAVDVGASELACPACAETMRAVHVTTIAGTIEVDRAPCCGGLYLDGGEWDPFVRAARVAQREAADRQFAQTGRAVGEAAVLQGVGSRSAMAQATASAVRGRVDSAMVKMMEQRARRERHRRGIGHDDW